MYHYSNTIHPKPPGKTGLKSAQRTGGALNLAIPRLATIFFFLQALTVNAQSITEIVTDYQGYWKSSSTAVNPVKPNNNHNLLSFTFNGARYSTGVNDPLLTTQGETFIAGDYRALPVQSVNGTINSNTKIGLGAMYDGVAVGPSNPPPSGNIPYYLTDGIKGLNIGTCVANLPAGTLFFSVGNINPSSIGDGIPDVVITQTADPSASSFDRYEFTDVNGNPVGNFKDIVLNSITPVGHWIADFYEASLNPIALAAGFTNTERAIRLWAADFSEFGITGADISSIAYFKIALNGNSDVAFVAYNNNAISFSFILPLQLSSFTASHTQEGVKLSWQTLSETNTDRFTIETSRDGINFTALAEKKAAGYSSSPFNYSYNHLTSENGIYYYRLKQIDQDGKFKYSKIVQTEITEKIAVKLYPNPAKDKLSIQHKAATGDEQLKIVTITGNVSYQFNLTPGSTNTYLNDLRLSKGLYFVVIIHGNEKASYPLLIH